MGPPLPGPPWQLLKSLTPKTKLHIITTNERTNSPKPTQKEDNNTILVRSNGKLRETTEAEADQELIDAIESAKTKATQAEGEVAVKTSQSGPGGTTTEVKIITPDEQ